jgi:hypothetical protein
MHNHFRIYNTKSESLDASSSRPHEEVNLSHVKIYHLIADIIILIAKFENKKLVIL